MQSADGNRSTIVVSQQQIGQVGTGLDIMISTGRRLFSKVIIRVISSFSFRISLIDSLIKPNSIRQSGQFGVPIVYFNSGTPWDEILPTAKIRYLKEY